MNPLQQMLAEKKLEEQKEKGEAQIPETSPEVEVETKVEVKEVEQDVKGEEVKITLPAALSSVKKGSYKDLRNKMIILASGMKMQKSPNGTYEPKTEEEKELCKYYESLAFLQEIK